MGGFKLCRALHCWLKPKQVQHSSSRQVGSSRRSPARRTPALPAPYPLHLLARPRQPALPDQHLAAAAAPRPAAAPSCRARTPPAPSSPTPRRCVCRGRCARSCRLCPRGRTGTAQVGGRERARTRCGAGPAEQAQGLLQQQQRQQQQQRGCCRDSRRLPALPPIRNTTHVHRRWCHCCHLRLHPIQTLDPPVCVMPCRTGARWQQADSWYQGMALQVSTGGSRLRLPLLRRHSGVLGQGSSCPQPPSHCPPSPARRPPSRPCCRQAVPIPSYLLALAVGNLESRRCVSCMARRYTFARLLWYAVHAGAACLRAHSGRLCDARACSSRQAGG